MTDSTDQVMPDLESARLEAEGDALKAAGKWREALRLYREAEAIVKHRRELYEKLLALHDLMSADETATFDEVDMSDAVYWTMQLQALDNPRLHYLHAHLSGKDRDIAVLIDRFLLATETEEGALLQEIEGLGVRALRPLLHVLLTLKTTLQVSEASAPARSSTGDIA